MPLSGKIFTAVLAGFAATSMVSPGLKGLGTPFFALRAGFRTVLIFIKPGRANSPAPPFLMCRSIKVVSSSSTELTCFLRELEFQICLSMLQEALLLCDSTVVLAGECYSAACFGNTSSSAIPDERCPLEKTDIVFRDRHRRHPSRFHHQSYCKQSLS